MSELPSPYSGISWLVSDLGYAPVTVAADQLDLCNEHIGRYFVLSASNELIRAEFSILDYLGRQAVYRVEDFGRAIDPLDQEFSRVASELQACRDALGARDFSDHAIRGLYWLLQEFSMETIIPDRLISFGSMLAVMNTTTGLSIRRDSRLGWVRVHLADVRQGFCEMESFVGDLPLTDAMPSSEARHFRIELRKAGSGVPHPDYWGDSIAGVVNLLDLLRIRAPDKADELGRRLDHVSPGDDSVLEVVGEMLVQHSRDVLTGDFSAFDALGCSL